MPKKSKRFNMDADAETWSDIAAVRKALRATNDAEAVRRGMALAKVILTRPKHDRRTLIIA